MARYDGLIIPRSWNEYINKSDAATLVQALQQNNVLDNAPTENSTKGVRSGGVYDALATKQPTLTFDDVPTEDSDNPVKSGGIYDALAGKQPTLTFDNVPTEDSDNPVKSGGIYDALAGKQNTLTFDDTPTASSNNPVKSDGIKTYVDQTYQKVRVKDYVTLLTTETTLTLEESLANIKTLEITVGATGIVRGSLVLPIGAFRNTGNKAIIMGCIAGNVHSVVIEYVDDTHIKAFTTEATNLNVIYIRGLKIR